MSKQQLSTNTFGCAKWIVSPTASDGTHTTISAALASASSGDTIFIRPGTYTENPTLKGGVNLTAYTADGNNGNVTIVGECTLTSGVLSITGINLETNGSYFLSVTGAGASGILIEDCYISVTDHTGINFTSSNADSLILIQNCQGSVGDTGITLYTMTSPGNLQILWSGIANLPSSTVASTNSSGTVSLLYSFFNLPMASSGTGGIGIQYSSVNTFSGDSVCVTFNGTGISLVIYSYFISDTSVCLSVGVGATVNTNMIDCRTSNVDIISGAGTVSYGIIAQGASTALVSANTIVPIPTTTGPLYSTGISFDNGANTLNFYSTGTFIPTIVGKTIAGATTYISQGGLYTRIGDRVFIDVSVSWSGTTGTGDLQIQGMPFTVNASAGTSIDIGTYAVATAAGTTNAYASPNPSTTTMDIYLIAIVAGTLSAAPIQNSGTILFQGFYQI